VCATAADLETQHAIDVALPLKPKLELILHSRVRPQPGGLGFYQVRAGPIVSWNASDRIALLAGYYFAQQERKADRDFIAGSTTAATATCGSRPFNSGRYRGAPTRTSDISTRNFRRVAPLPEPVTS